MQTKTRQMLGRVSVRQVGLFVPVVPRPSHKCHLKSFTRDRTSYAVQHFQAALSVQTLRGIPPLIRV